MLTGGAAARRAGVLVVLVSAVLSTSVGTAHAVTSNGRICTKVGTAGADRLVGTSGNDVLCGLGGNDRVFGLGGNDVLDGGAGDDVLLGGQGADVLSGGPGTDTSQYDDHTTGVTVVLDGRADDGSVGERDTTRADVEAVLGTPYADTLTGNAANNRLDGGLGNDRLTGLAGNDTLLGGRGNDVLLGGDGSDRLLGQYGGDRSDGGPGGDLLDDFGAADAVTGGAGTDWCHAQAPTSCEVKAGVYTPNPVAIVTGRLRDATGAAVSSATLVLGGLVLTTDSGGAFSGLVPVTAGQATATVTVPGGTWSGKLALASDRPLALTLPPLRTTTVHVQDHTGAPLPDAFVQMGAGGLAPLAGLAGSEGARGGSTDADGDYRFPSYRTTLPRTSVLFGEQRTEPADLVLSPEGRAVVVVDRSPVAVTGTVRTADGTPVDAGVTLTSGPVTGDVTEAGAWSLSGLRATQTLTVAPFARPGVPRDLVLSTDLGTLAAPVTVDVALPPLTTQVVRAVDATGAPVPGATVRVSAFAQRVDLGGRSWLVSQEFDTVVTDSAGEVRLPVAGTPTGTVVVSLQRGQASYRVDLQAALGGGPLVVAFDGRSADLTGTVRAGDQVVADAFVSWIRTAGGAGHATSGSDGRFDLTAWLGSGDLTWGGKASGPGPVSFQARVQTSVDGPRVLDLDVGPLTALTLHLVDAAGAPVAGAAVSGDPSGALALPGTSYSYQSLRLPAGLRSDADGNVVITALAGTLSGYLRVDDPGGTTRYGRLSDAVLPGTTTLVVS